MTNDNLILELNRIYHDLERIKRSLNGKQLLNHVGVDIDKAMQHVQSAIIGTNERKY
jgi:hypothetical protein